MDQSRFIAQHVINLPKSGIRDFFDIVARMKERHLARRYFQNHCGQQSSALNFFHEHGS
jgi:hypothetical protein